MDVDELHAFLNRYYAANVQGKPADLLAFWEPGRRASLERTFAKPGLWERNRKAMQARRGYSVHGALLQGEVLSLLISRGSPWVLGVNLRAKGASFELVADAPDDLQLAIVEASFSK